MALTKEQQDYLNEVVDPQKVALYCGTHMYFGPSKAGTVGEKPHMGCPKCCFVMYFHDLATTPPDKRAQRLDELDEVLHKVVEEVEAGRWDFQALRHAEVKVESN